MFFACIGAEVPPRGVGIPRSLSTSRCAHFVLINTRARAQGFCICTMLARVLVYKNGAHDGTAGAQDRTGKQL
jgi:hypothetical protein